MGDRRNPVMPTLLTLLTYFTYLPASKRFLVPSGCPKENKSPTTGHGRCGHELGPGPGPGPGAVGGRCSLLVEDRGPAMDREIGRS